jgi:hypothetical protein
LLVVGPVLGSSGGNLRPLSRTQESQTIGGILGARTCGAAALACAVCAGETCTLGTLGCVTSAGGTNGCAAAGTHTDCVGAFLGGCADLAGPFACGFPRNPRACSSYAVANCPIAPATTACVNPGAAQAHCANCGP